jgi:hypothetical protein
LNTKINAHYLVNPIYTEYLHLVPHHP